MGKEIKIIGIVLIILLSGCKSNNFYKAVSSMRLDKTSKVSTLFDNKQKNVFTQLSKELKNTNHIIYLYMPNYTSLSRMTKGFIYDIDNKQYISIIFEGENAIVKKIEYPIDSYEAFILENYLDKKYEYLQNLYKNYAASSGASENVIYDIDLKQKKYTQFSFFNFIFLDGKPYDGMDPIEDDNGSN